MKIGWLLLALSLPALTQTAPQWVISDKKDPMRDTVFVEFSLEGQFLTAPTSAAHPPMMVIDCIPPKSKKGGNLSTAYVSFGTVLNYGTQGVFVEYRLNDGRVHNDLWPISTDGKSAIAPVLALNDMLWGHRLFPRAGKMVANKKVLVSAEEFGAGRVVVEFDLPDPTAVSEACGLVIH
jgi:hypothetical protein